MRDDTDQASGDELTSGPGVALLEVVAVMDRLLSPTGCPWDREQTHGSLTRYLVEETYELLEAIDSQDRTHLREELGDVLLQVVFHCRIAMDDPADPFDIDEVAQGIADLTVTTGGGPNLTQEQRIECLGAGPEMASLNMGSLMRLSGQWKGVPFSNMPDEIETFLAKMKAMGIKPEMEVYNFALFREVNDIIQKGLVEKV